MSPKQFQFCQEYIIDLNGKAAAIRAGYKPTSAETMASKLMMRQDIKEYIRELKQIRAERTGITADEVIEELAAIGFYNIQDLINDDMSIVNMKKANRKSVTPVIGIEVTESFSGTGKKRTKTVQTKVKLADKTNALIHLGKHLGIFEKDNAQKSMKIKVTRK